ncbi:MAG: hypothetical protein GY869_09335, partial [Planctomycetes bacterium]|nr:hypothetical protein [Planctomycetota bacterium]
PDITSISVGNAGSIFEGDDLSLIATATDPGNDPLEFLWDLDADGVFDDAAGDSTIVPWAALEQLALPSDGSPLPIQLKVSDGQGGFDVSQDITFRIINRDPIADAGGPYTRKEGRGVWLDASGSTDHDGNDILSYTWKVDVGSTTYDLYQGPDSVVKIPWRHFENIGVAGDGTDMKLRLVVRDQDGGVNRDRTSTLTYNNVDPIADAGGPYMILEGQGVQLRGGSSYDVNDNDYPLTYQWFVGEWDGVNVLARGKNPFVLWDRLDNLELASDGTPLGIGLKVTDQDGGEDLDKSLLMTISNAAPDIKEVFIGNNGTINEG